MNASNIGTNINSTFNKFVEGDERGGPSSAPSHRRNQSTVDPEKKDFWDAFGAAPAEPEKKDFWDAFGAAPGGPAAEKKDFWDAFGAPVKGPTVEKKDFWDSFADAGSEARRSLDAKSVARSSIGTSAMGKGSASGQGHEKKKSDGDEWSEW